MKIEMHCKMVLNSPGILAEAGFPWAYHFHPLLYLPEANLLQGSEEISQANREKLKVPGAWSTW